MSSSSAGSPSRRESSSAFRAKVRSRLIRSIARFRAAVTIHAPGLIGMPSRGQRSSAVAKASCTASSASSKSPRTRMRIETARLHSSRKTCSIDAGVGASQSARRQRVARDPASIVARVTFVGTRMLVLNAEPQGGSRSIRTPRRNDACEPDRLVQVGELGQEHAADQLLRLGKGSVGDDALSVPDAHHLGLGGAVELDALACSDRPWRSPRKRRSSVASPPRVGRRPPPRSGRSRRTGRRRRAVRTASQASAGSK